jgi:CheY-like chemotaxis protein
MLESLGYQVKSVSSGSDAIDILMSKQLRIDLVILDMVMPRMNGRETFEKIKIIDPKMKVLVSSGYSKETQIEKMIESGCRGFILKPFDVATLSEKLNGVFKTRAIV